MTDESKPMHDSTDTQDARQHDGGSSSSLPKSGVPAKPTHGDPDRRSIGDENDRGLRQDTQSAGSGARSGGDRSTSDRSNDDRSKSKDQEGRPQQQGSPALKLDEPRTGGGERSAPGKDGRANPNESQDNRRAK